MRSLSSESQRGPLPCRYTTTINYHCHGSADDDDAPTVRHARRGTTTAAGAALAAFAPNSYTSFGDMLALQVVGSDTPTLNARRGTAKHPRLLSLQPLLRIQVTSCRE